MEEIIEQLREANEPVPVPLELPDEDQIVEIEEQLFIDIPFVFREFLLTVSDVVYGSLEPVTVTDPQIPYLPAGRCRQRLGCWRRSQHDSDLPGR